MTKIIIVTGIPGSGKTTVLEQLRLLCPEAAFVNYGDSMLSQATHLGISRDMLRKLPIQKQQDIGLQAAKKIAELQNEIILVDTHAYIKTQVSFCPGIPQPILQILRPQALVAIECSPDVIFARRAQDSSRKRDFETIEQIDYHQSLNRSFLAACSALTGAELLCISNEGTPQEAAQAVMQLFSE